MKVAQHQNTCWREADVLNVWIHLFYILAIRLLLSLQPFCIWMVRNTVQHRPLVLYKGKHEAVQMYVLRRSAPKTEWLSSLLHKPNILRKEWWSTGGLGTKPSTQTFFLLVEKCNGSRLVCLVPHHRVPAVIPEAMDSWKQRCVMPSTQAGSHD